MLFDSPKPKNHEATALDVPPRLAEEIAHWVAKMNGERRFNRSQFGSVSIGPLPRGINRPVTVCLPAEEDGSRSELWAELETFVSDATRALK